MIDFSPKHNVWIRNDDSPGARTDLRKKKEPNMKKRILSTLTILALCLSLLPTAALAAAQGFDTEGDTLTVTETDVQLTAALLGGVTNLMVESGASAILQTNVSLTSVTNHGELTIGVGGILEVETLSNDNTGTLKNNHTLVLPGANNNGNSIWAMNLDGDGTVYLVNANGMVDRGSISAYETYNNSGKRINDLSTIGSGCSVDFDNSATTYSGSPIPHVIATLPSSVASVTYTYTGTGSTSYGPSTTPPANAGTYKVTATFTMKSGYDQLDPVSSTLTIRKHGAFELFTGAYIDTQKSGDTEAIDLTKISDFPANPGGTPAFTVSGSYNGVTADVRDGSTLVLTSSGQGNHILDPKGPATRAEVAQMMKNFIDISHKN
jgi:hypothetical protein